MTSKGGGGVEPNVTGSLLVRTLDKKAKGYLKAFQRSISSSALDRNSSSIAAEDPSDMTIDFLRARLQSQRADYRSEKQRAQVLAKKVLELEHKLHIEVQLRKRAEYENLDASRRHDREFIGPHGSLSFSERVYETSEGDEEQGYGGSSSRLLSSSSAGDSDEGGIDGVVHDAYNDGDEDGHFKVSSWQTCSHCRGPQSLNNTQKEQCQSPNPNHLCHGHPSKSSHKKECNAFSTAHKKKRRRQRQWKNHPKYHSVEPKQHESEIVAVQMEYEKQGIVEKEPEKGLQTCEEKLQQQNASNSLQYQSSNDWQHAKSLSSRIMDSKEDSSHNTTFGAQKHVEVCANCFQDPLHLKSLSRNAAGIEHSNFCSQVDTIPFALGQSLYKKIHVENNQGFGVEVLNGTVNGAQAYRGQCSTQVSSDEGSIVLPQGVQKAGRIRRHDAYVRQPIHGASPLTKRVESGISSPLHRDAVPSQLLILQRDLDQCVIHDRYSTDQPIKLANGSISTVTEMLKLLKIKQQVQKADKHLKLPHEGGQHAARQAALLKTGHRYQLPGRSQSPSRFFVETAAPDHLPSTSTLQQ